MNEILKRLENGEKVPYVCEMIEGQRKCGFITLEESEYSNGEYPSCLGEALVFRTGNGDLTWYDKFEHELLEDILEKGKFVAECGEYLN